MFEQVGKAVSLDLEISREVSERRIDRQHVVVARDLHRLATVVEQRHVAVIEASQEAQDRFLESPFVQILAERNLEVRAFQNVADAIRIRSPH